VVYHAEDRLLEAEVAVKVVKTNLALHRRFRARFAREVAISARIVHPHVIPVHDTGVLATGEPFVALGYAAGGSLADLLKLRPSIAEVLRLVDEVQYQRRRQKFEFDMMIGTWVASASPGNEQRSRWGSSSADQEASFNLAGARSPAIDRNFNGTLAAQRLVVLTDLIIFREVGVVVALAIPLGDGCDFATEREPDKHRHFDS
jgi:hypothetical protein